MSNLEIVFDDNVAVYFSGQIVSGSLKFSLFKEKKVKGVTITFFGAGKCSWTEKHTQHRGNTRIEVTTIYGNEEVYLNQMIYVAGGPTEEIVLPPGVYSYPFRYLLPAALPSSFEGEHGYVRFQVKGALQRPWRFDHKCKRAFTIICPLDLNRVPGLQEPFKAAQDKVLCCGCCASSPLTLAVMLPYRGFVPGQQTKTLVEVDNPTTSTVTVKSQLIQVVHYIAANGTRYEVQKVVAKEKMGTAEKRGSLTQQSALRVPPLPASMMQFCNCLDVSYTLQFLAEVSGAHGSLVVNVPITIGTIPLISLMSYIVGPQGQMQVEPSQVQAGANEIQMGFMAAQGDSLAQYPQMPPPTYEESVLGRTNIISEEDGSHMQGNMEFAPKYPMYTFQ